MAKAKYKDEESLKNAKAKLTDFKFREMKDGKVLVDINKKKKKDKKCCGCEAK